ncbi:AraC family transcriptional regulator [Actinokineospora bangkokensis]|uniref:AraC family transcriptional regulator n=1 Tax=Actinokineospora bangkokensis TaxID=1193682 RepID=A0A1Q9LJ65_9PSEU|nr:AraC family transcriptional regulator [Actinokineospora bangkokensis]OLR92076.1 AraC family transcriptional regulator [Actinokineospora bangkokensis]
MEAFPEAAVRHWDYPRGVAGVRLLADYAAELGITIPPVPVEGLVPAQVELAVVRALARAVPAAGVELGTRYHVTTFGMLGYAVLSSPTLAAAVDVTLRYLDLSFIFCVPRLSLHGDVLHFELDAGALPGDVARFLVERDLAAINTVLGELVPGGIALAELVFGFPEPVEAGPYREVFGVEPGFGAAVTRAAFPAAELDRPLPQADPVTVAECERRCRDLVQARRRRRGVTGAVRAELAGVGGMGLGAAEVAARLLVGERTLRRRLAEAGTSFRELRDEVRQALAEQLLDDGALSVADIATRLGYAEPASFIHAFTRWTGRTPGAHRRR